MQKEKLELGTLRKPEPECLFIDIPGFHPDLQEDQIFYKIQHCSAGYDEKRFYRVASREITPDDFIVLWYTDLDMKTAFCCYRHVSEENWTQTGIGVVRNPNLKSPEDETV